MYQWTGENVGISYGLDDTTKAIEQLMDSWWSEHVNATAEIIASFDGR